MKLPIDFENRMKNLLGKEYDDYLDSFDAPAQKALQLNTARMCREDFAEIANFPMEPIPHLPNAYYIAGDKLGANPLHHAGVIYSQDPSAMLPVGAFAISPDWKVLDVCAAPGGKSFQIAARLQQGNGFLVSNEYNSARNKILVANAERMGFDNMVITHMDSAELAMCFPGTFDLVVVDAPCSGEGMFRKYPESITQWSAENVTLCAKRQKEILSNAIRCLKPGGYLIYSTCTYAPEENEQIIDDLLSNYPLEVILPAKQYLAFTTNNAQGQRFYPHKGKGEGQFYCHLKLIGDSQQYNLPKKLPLKPASKQTLCLIRETMKDSICMEDNVLVLPSFHRDSLTIPRQNYIAYEYKDQILFLPEKITLLPPHGITACGIKAGTIEKKRFVPHHQLFHCLGAYFQNIIYLSMEDPLLASYLQGNEIFLENTPNGYGIISIASPNHNCAFIGGYKASNGRLKNHYPKGLRAIHSL
ncbi:MAG: methyltransferase domain-containing protein [Lachnospiraceae bacterium]